VVTRFWSDSPSDLRGIDGVWRHAESADEREHALGLGERQFVPPDGCSDLILHFSRGRLQAAFVQEPSLVYDVVEIAPEDALFGVRFAIGIGGSLLRRRELIASEAQRLFARAEGRDTNGVTAELVRHSTQLLERYGDGRPEWLSEALRLAQDRFGDVSVLELARSVHVSERTLRRACLDWVGSGPKPLLRTLRIREAVARAHGTQPLAEIAAELGFADQAHLSREMRGLWGTTPGQLRGMSDFFKTAAAGVP
jgi:AraC-like DNA-binding protein